MLKLALILLSLAVWVSIFAYFWHQNILRWLDNRFGRDTLPSDPDEEGAEGLDHNTPLFTAPPNPKTENPRLASLLLPVKGLLLILCR